jgi:hypothetical protein
MQAVESAALGEIATEIRDKLQKVINTLYCFNSAPYSASQIASKMNN